MARLPFRIDFVFGLVAELHMPEKRCAHNGPILRTIAALFCHLIHTLFRPIHVFLAALFTLFDCRHILKDPDEINVGLIRAGMDIADDHKVLDPAL